MAKHKLVLGANSHVIYVLGNVMDLANRNSIAGHRLALVIIRLDMRNTKKLRMVKAAGSRNRHADPQEICSRKLSLHLTAVCCRRGLGQRH